MDKLKKGVNDVYCSNQDNLKIVFSADREHYFCMRLLKMVGKLIMGGVVVLLMGVTFTCLQTMHESVSLQLFWAV